MPFTGDSSSNPLVCNAADVAGGAVQLWPPPIDTVNARPDASIHHALMLGVEVEFQEVGAGDTCVVNQLNGKPIWVGHAAADGETVRSGVLPGPFDGVVIPVGGITNGKVLVYHR